MRTVAVGRSGGTRTPNPRFWRPVLWPIELHSYDRKSLNAGNRLGNSLVFRIGFILNRQSDGVLNGCSLSVRESMRVSLSRSRQGALQGSLGVALVGALCSVTR